MKKKMFLCIDLLFDSFLSFNLNIFIKKKYLPFKRVSPLRIPPWISFFTRHVYFF